MNIIDKTIQDIITEDKVGYEIHPSDATGTMYSESFLKEVARRISRQVWYEAGYRHLQVDLSVCDAFLEKEVDEEEYVQR